MILARGTLPDAVLTAVTLPKGFIALGIPPMGIIDVKTVPFAAVLSCVASVAEGRIAADVAAIVGTAAGVVAALAAIAADEAATIGTDAAGEVEAATTGAPAFALDATGLAAAGEVAGLEAGFVCGVLEAGAG